MTLLKIGKFSKKSGFAGAGAVFKKKEEGERVPPSSLALDLPLMFVVNYTV